MPAMILAVVCLVTTLQASKGGDAAIKEILPPLDVDAAVPPVVNQPCPLAEILQSTSHQTRKLVENMQQFSARERLEYSQIDGAGHVRGSRTATFTYVADIHEVRPGQLTVEEYRNDGVGAQSFPSRLATTGTAAFALIFHPDYIGDFEVTCEGFTELEGKPAWQLHFVQRRTNNFRGYRVAAAYYPVELKGRAWISAESHQVLRLETDLLRTIADIKLRREHVVIDYGPVHFASHKLTLWLPQSTAIYMDYRGKRYFHRHSFSDFKLFWVDTDQEAKLPALQ